jgi:MATE family multidrug resistance protein
VGLGLLFQRGYREEYATLAGARFDRALFLRMMRFGLPSGVFGALDCLGFTLFVLLVGGWARRNWRPPRLPGRST